MSNSAAQTIFRRMFESGEDAAVISEREGLRQVSDDGQLVEWIDAVIAANPNEAERLRAGEKKLTGVLVGLVMKMSGGKADPKKMNRCWGSGCRANLLKS